MGYKIENGSEKTRGWIRSINDFTKLKIQPVTKNRIGFDTSGLKLSDVFPILNYNKYMYFK